MVTPQLTTAASGEGLRIFQTVSRVTLRHNRSGEDQEECREGAFLGRADHSGVAASRAGRAHRRSLSQGRRLGADLLPLEEGVWQPATERGPRVEAAA